MRGRLFSRLYLRRGSRSKTRLRGFDQVYVYVDAFGRRFYPKRLTLVGM